MNTFIICMLVAGIVVALTFSIAFFTEVIIDKSLSKKKPKATVVSSADDIDIDEMLRALEEKTKVIESAKAPEEAKEDQVQPTDESISDEELTEILDNLTNRNTKIIDTETEADVIISETVDGADKVDEKVAGEKEEKAKEAVVTPAEVVEKVSKPTKGNTKTIDYKARLEQIRLSLETINKDYDKAQAATSKVERIQRRVERNEKLLNKKAGELANLNLIMYKVNNIKDIDESKKQKQEELSSHVSEIKASIADGKDYIKKNKTKNEANIKLCQYLEGEQARYKEEIAHLEKLIADAE